MTADTSHGPASGGAGADASASSDDETSSATKTKWLSKLPPRLQRMWPILVLAILVIAVGAYLWLGQSLSGVSSTDPSSGWGPKGTTSVASGTTAPSSVDLSKECPGKPETFDLATDEKKVINANSCQLRWVIRFGCVRALDGDGTILMEKACAGGGEANVPEGLHTVVAVDGPVKLKRIECDPRSTGNLLDRCI